MVFKMINNLSRIEITNGGSRRMTLVSLGLLGAVHRSIERRQIVAYTIAFSGLWLLGTQSFEFDTLWDRLPLEVEHRVHRLDFDPPVSFFHGPPNQHWIVTWRHDKFIAIFDVCVLKRYLWFLLFFAIKVYNHPLFLTRSNHLLLYLTSVL